MACEKRIDIRANIVRCMSIDVHEERNERFGLKMVTLYELRAETRLGTRFRCRCGRKASSSRSRLQSEDEVER